MFFAFFESDVLFATLIIPVPLCWVEVSRWAPFLFFPRSLDSLGIITFRLRSFYYLFAVRYWRFLLFFESSLLILCLASEMYLWPLGTPVFLEVLLFSISLPGACRSFFFIVFVKPSPFLASFSYL